MTSFDADAFVLPAYGEFRIGKTSVPFHNACTAEANALYRTPSYWSEPNARGTRYSMGGEWKRPLSSTFHYPLRLGVNGTERLLKAARATPGRSYEKPETGLKRGPGSEAEWGPATHILVDVAADEDGPVLHQAIVFVTADGACFADYRPDFMEAVNCHATWADIPAIWAMQRRYCAPTRWQHARDTLNEVLAACYIIGTGLFALISGRRPGPIG